MELLSEEVLEFFHSPVAWEFPSPEGTSQPYKRIQLAFLVPSMVKSSVFAFSVEAYLF